MTGDAVVLKRAGDGQRFTLPLAQLQRGGSGVGAESGATPKPAAAAAPAGAPKAVAGPYAAMITGDWAQSTFKNLPYALYGAKDLDASKTYPLIVALHGKSSNNENGKQIGGGLDKSFTKPERYKKNPCLILAPCVISRLAEGVVGGARSPATRRSTSSRTW